jgi:ATP-dependent Lhr-like helicase
LAPDARFAGLSATVADPAALMRYLTPEPERAVLVQGEAGAEPDVRLLIPEREMPWAGTVGLYAAADVYELIRAARLALVFVNTRARAELVFGALWRLNRDDLPIALHHGSLAVEQRRKVEAAMAAGSLRAVVATSSLDLGIDWGDIDLVVRWGAPRGRHGCSSGSAAPTTGSTSRAAPCSSRATGSRCSNAWPRRTRWPSARWTAG